MNCDLARTEMIAYLQSELPTEQKAPLELHLAGCPDCRAQLKEARRILEWTSAASDETVVRAVDEMIQSAIAAGASDIHLDPQSDNALRMRYRVDGVLQDVRRFDPLMRDGIVTRLKLMCEMNVAEKRPQDGLCSFTAQNGTVYELIVLTNPFLWGDGVVIRFLDKGRALAGMSDLGLSVQSRAEIEHLLHQPGGLLLVTGPSGSPIPPSGAGNPYMLYAMLQEINDPAIKIVTFEKPAVYRVEGICQSMQNGAIGYTLPLALRCIMRMDPDVVMLGEVPDVETARLCVQLALAGQLVIAALDTGDALFALQHLRNLGVDDAMLGGTLIGIVGQRLIRKVCPVCRQEYTPEPTDPRLAALGIPPEDAAGSRLVRGAGCDACRHTGYRGRTSLFEVLTLNREIGALIGTGADLAAIASAARAAGHRSLRDDGRQKALDGITTPEEIVRALA